MNILIAANWKMNKSCSEAYTTAKTLSKLLKSIPKQHEVVIFPPFTAIVATQKGLETSQIALGGQNFYPALSGAFTGETSIVMLKDIGCSWILIGHSERRHILQESETFIAQKTSFALEQNFYVILCVGETESQRNSGQLKKILQQQLHTALIDIPKNKMLQLVIAYEPVWAIGTGHVASKKDILEAHAFIKSILYDILGDISQKIRIIYGGSVKPENTQDILMLDNVHGLLVGGASLKAESFINIIQSSNI